MSSNAMPEGKSIEVSDEEHRAELLCREWERVASYRERALMEARNGNLFPRIKEDQMPKASPNDTYRARLMLKSMSLNELLLMRAAYDRRTNITKCRKWIRTAIQAIRQAEAALACLNEVLDSPDAHSSAQSFRNGINAFNINSGDYKMFLQRSDVEGRADVAMMFSRWDPLIHARNMFLNKQISEKQALAKWEYEDKCIAFLAWGPDEFKVDQAKIDDLAYRAKIVMMAHAAHHMQLCQHGKQFDQEYINQRKDFGINSKECLCSHETLV